MLAVQPILRPRLAKLAIRAKTFNASAGDARLIVTYAPGMLMVRNVWLVKLCDTCLVLQTVLPNGDLNGLTDNLGPRRHVAASFLSRHAAPSLSLVYFVATGTIAPSVMGESLRTTEKVDTAGNLGRKKILEKNASSATTSGPIVNNSHRHNALAFRRRGAKYRKNHLRRQDRKAKKSTSTGTNCRSRSDRMISSRLHC